MINNLQLTNHYNHVFLYNLFEVGVSVKSIQEICQHLMTKLILLLSNFPHNYTVYQPLSIATYVVGQHCRSLESHALDKLEYIHHRLCLHPLHLSMCGNERSSPAHSITNTQNITLVSTLISNTHTHQPPTPTYLRSQPDSELVEKRQKNGLHSPHNLACHTTIMCQHQQLQLPASSITKMAILNPGSVLVGSQAPPDSSSLGKPAQKGGKNK